MKRVWILGIVCCAGVLWGQQSRESSTYYTFDVNGNPVGGRQVSATARKGEKTHTERIESINGRMAPVDRVEEKVIESSPRKKVIERTVQLYDQQGNPTQRKKERIEELVEPGGRRVTTTTVYQTDLNGSLRLRERRKESVRTSHDGKQMDANITIERPTLSGGMGVAERRVVSERLREDGAKRDETIYRPDQSGSMRAEAREVTDTVVDKNKEVRTKTVYNTVNATGRMGFAAQTVTDIEKSPDGSESKVVNEYGAAAMGRPIEAGAIHPSLREQVIVKRKVQPDGRVVETTGVRRASLADPKQLGAYQPVSEMICTGNCLPPKPAPKKEAKPATGQKQQP